MVIKYAIRVTVAIVLAATSLCAQVSTSTISGSVQDASGAAVAGATVVAKNEGTGLTYGSKTTNAGDYSLSALPPGTYSITVTQQGFKTFTSIHNTLTVGAPLVVEAKLQLGAVTDTVQVESSYERIQTSNATLGDVVSRRQVQELPLNGRNPLSLIVLEPGLVQRSNKGAGSGTHVFGSRDRAHNITIDGIDANESSVPNPQSNIFRLTPDNVQEYRVVTHNATPEYGRNSGANVAIATRGGTNDYHGDVYWYHRNSALNANESFNLSNPQGVLPRPVLLLHQYGLDTGGPIIKNKTFYFFSWQNNRIAQTQPISASFRIPRVYTDTLKKEGKFRYFVPDPKNPTIINGTQVTRNSTLLVDPATGALRVPLCATDTSVGCIQSYNIVDKDPAGIGFDRTMLAMFNKFPSPNIFDAVGDGLNFAGYAWNPPSRFSGPFYLSRVDHKLNDNNNLSGTLLLTTFNTENGDFLNGRPSVFPGFAPLGEVFRTSKLLSLSYRRTFSPHLVNEFTTGFSRFNFFFGLVEANSKNGDVPPPYGQRCFGTPSLRNVDTPYCNTPHTQRAVTNLQFIDNLSYALSSHTVRLGTNIRMYRHNDQRGVPGGFNEAPTIIFDRLTRTATSRTAPTPCPSPCGFALPTSIDSADKNALENAILELVGIPAQIQQAFPGNPVSNTYTTGLSVLGTRAKQFDVYIQDEWKIKRNLTMTYGVRWEYNRPPRDCCGRTFVPNRPIDGSKGIVSFVPSDSWWQRSNKNAFGPRIGIAWDPRSDGKTVVRAGYGIAFDTLSTFQVTAIGGKVPGISAQQCRVRVQDTPDPICGGVGKDLRLTALLAAVNPFTLATPVSKPTSNTSPAPQRLTGAPDVGAFDQNLQMPTVHEWNLTAQRQLPWNIVAQVGYVGKRGTHLFRAYDLNQNRTDQPGFRESFMIARQNVLNGCRPDGSRPDGARPDKCPVAGTPPALLLQLAPAATLNNLANDFFLNGLGDVAANIDTAAAAFNLFSKKPAFGANYFRPNAQFSQIFYFDSGGDSYYHGMIVQLQRQFEKGLTLNLAYTLSKSIDDMSVDPVGAASGGALSTTNSRTPTDVHNFSLDRARSDFDNRQVLVLNALYELPFGRGKKWGANWSGVLNQILGGWTTTGIYIFQSGEPFSLNSGVRTAHSSHQSRPDLRGPLPDFALTNAPGIQGPVFIRANDSIKNPSDPNFNCRQVVNTQTFFCIPQPGESGMGRNTINGPHFWNMDFGILKTFPVSERLRLQLRIEFFNVFNHPNYENPRNASIGGSSLTSTGGFGRTCCSTASVPSSATVIATGEPERVIQFSLRVSF